MNQKRSPRSKQPEGLFQIDRAIEKAPNLHQSNPLPGLLRSVEQNRRWTYFNRGFFWGGLVSLISICSALGGMALTKIDGVEQQISERLQDRPRLTAVESDAITTPLQILLLEVEADNNTIVELDRLAAGKIKTVLLLTVEPELDLARAVNIPLNTQVRISGIGKGTVADAYNIGGIDLLSSTINQLDEKIEVNRYLSTSSAVFQQLAASGQITQPKCDPRIRDCLDPAEQLVRQETTFETIRQRFNIPTYWASFEATLGRIEPQLDTNVSTTEIVQIANFIKELEPERLNVELIRQYTSSKTVFDDEPLAKSRSDTSVIKQDIARADYGQNTFVYLMKQMPLELKQTKMAIDCSSVEKASHLKNALEFGNLESVADSDSSELVVSLGKDALNLSSD